MRWVGALLVIVLVALAGSSVGLAAPTHVPEVTNLKATPSSFCAKKSSTCSHPGTTVTFNVSTAATVRADIRPRFENTSGFVEFVKKFPKGANSIRLNDGRLKRGRWTLRVQATNNVGTGPIAVVDVHVVKHG
jgi:hypothetical protein